MMLMTACSDNEVTGPPEDFLGRLLRRNSLRVSVAGIQLSLRHLSATYPVHGIFIWINSPVLFAVHSRRSKSFTSPITDTCLLTRPFVGYDFFGVHDHRARNDA